MMPSLPRVLLLAPPPLRFSSTVIAKDPSLPQSEHLQVHEVLYVTRQLSSRRDAYMLGALAFQQLPANSIEGRCRSGQGLDEAHHRPK